MKVKVFILSLLFIFFQFELKACTDEFNQFTDNISSLRSKRLLMYEDLLSVQKEFENLEILLKNQACEKETIKSADAILMEFKEKRIRTLETYKKMNIAEEAGMNLSEELAYLNGKNSKFQYPNGSNFLKRDLPIKRPIEVEIIVEKKYEAKKPDYQLQPDKFNKIMADNGNPKCPDVINQNEAVNLNNVRDQDTVGWCYAYSASDLLSFRLKKVISAVSLYDSGQTIAKDIATDEGKGGYIDESITKFLNNNKGLCLEKNLPSSDFAFCTHTRYVDFLRSLLRHSERGFNQGSLDDLFCMNQNIGLAFPGMGIDRVRSLANVYGKDQLLERLFKEQCKELAFQDFKAQPQVFNNTRYTVDTILSKINEQLNKGDIAAVAYKYHLISPERNGDHASVVVGRRFNKESNKCEFLVRNSWGKACSQKEENGVSCHKNCDGNGCRYSGHFWVAEDRFKTALTGVTFLP